MSYFRKNPNGDGGGGVEDMEFQEYWNSNGYISPLPPLFLFGFFFWNTGSLMAPNRKFLRVFLLFSGNEHSALPEIAQNMEIRAWHEKKFRSQSCDIWGQRPKDKKSNWKLWNLKNVYDLGSCGLKTSLGQYYLGPRTKP